MTTSFVKKYQLTSCTAVLYLLYKGCLSDFSGQCNYITVCRNSWMKFTFVIREWPWYWVTSWIFPYLSTLIDIIKACFVWFLWLCNKTANIWHILSCQLCSAYISEWIISICSKINSYIRGCVGSNDCDRLVYSAFCLTDCGWVPSIF